MKYILPFLFLLTACGGFVKESKKEENKQEKEVPQKRVGLRGEKDFNQLYDMKSLFTWKAGPFVGAKDDNLLRIKFVSNDEKTVPKVEGLRFWPYMKIHGHGAGGEMKLTPKANGEYEATGFIFVMDGPWELEVRVKLDGIPYSLSIPIELKD